MHDPTVTERKKKESAAKVAAAESQGRWPSNIILTYPDDSYMLRDEVKPEQLRELAEWMDANA